MFHRAIGENELAPRQGRQRCPKVRVFMHDAHIYIVHEFEKLIGADIMASHQPAHGRPIFDIIGFLQPPRFAALHLKTAANEFGHARVDLCEKLAVGGIQRVIEIEDPAFHMGEIRRHVLALGRRRHCAASSCGLANIAGVKSKVADSAPPMSTRRNAASSRS